MKFTVESWDSEYGAPTEPELDDATESVDTKVEVRDPAEWRPISPQGEPVGDVLFVDGVRRVDATLWIEQPPDFPGLGLAATYAAGAVRCQGVATLEEARVERGLFTATGAEDIETRVGNYGVKATKGSTSEELWWGIQQRMGDLETEVAREAGDAELLVVDGPLFHVRQLPNAVGYIKTQRVHYLPVELRPVLTSLPARHRTPVFLTSASWSRFSWYLRLANQTGPAGGLVRCEVDADQSAATAIATAGRVSCTLPRFASAPHKDPRAPQNLYPIGGMERQLRRRLGDKDLAVRALRSASAVS